MFSTLVVPGNHWTMLFGENSKAIGRIISSIIRNDCHQHSIAPRHSTVTVTDE